MRKISAEKSPFHTPISTQFPPLGIDLNNLSRGLEGFVRPRNQLRFTFLSFPTFKLARASGRLLSAAIYLSARRS